MDSSYRTVKLKNFEKLTIDGNEYVLDFRPVTGHADVSNLLDAGWVNTAESPHGSLAEYRIGSGSILYCPYPVELSTNTEAMTACYTYAIRKANAQNAIYQLLSGRPQIVFTAVSYETCTVYTLINEGFADSLSFTDLRSQKNFSVYLPENQGCKLWLSSDGTLLQKYGEADVTIL